MKRKILRWTIAGAALLIAVFTYLILTGERGLYSRSKPLRVLDVSRLPDAETQALGWKPRNLDAVYDYAARLSSDTLLIVTNGKTVGAFGDLAKPHATHSIRKSLLSALVGQHIGIEPHQIPLNATLQELAINDTPRPLTSQQRQAMVLHLLKSTSGINHTAAAEAGLTSEKNRRLGNAGNKPGTIWAYNNWDYNALTTIFERRTGQSIADAFQTGIAKPVGMQDFDTAAVSYLSAPKRSQHKAASFRMSTRDLAKFGQLFLNKGQLNGQQILPASWVDRIARDPSETGRKGLRWAHNYLWWIPDPGSGLPKGTFWAWGLSNQAVFVVPAWQTVIVHQADTTEFLKRFIPVMSEGEAAIEKMILSCRRRANRKTEHCIEHRFVTRREIQQLVSLIVEARL